MGLRTWRCLSCGATSRCYLSFSSLCAARARCQDGREASSWCSIWCTWSLLSARRSLTVPIGPWLARIPPLGRDVMIVHEAFRFIFEGICIAFEWLCEGPFCCELVVSFTP